MATIKTKILGDQRRIITKVVGEQRRISCSCCDGQGCCMYPADQFDILYGFDDLPDIIQCEVGEFSEAYKVNDGDGAVYKTPWLPIAPPNNTSLHRIEIGGNWILSTPDFDGIEGWVPMGTETAPLWRMTLRVEEEDNMRGLFPENGCLFGGLFLGGDPWPSLPSLGNWNRFVQDNFEDTYTITVFNIFVSVGSVYATNTVNRVSRCEWRGERLNEEGVLEQWQLLYADKTTNTNLKQKWAVTIGTFEGGSGGSKTGAGNFQNTPEGDYFYHQDETLKLATVSI